MLLFKRRCIAVSTSNLAYADCHTEANPRIHIMEPAQARQSSGRNDTTYFDTYEFEAVPFINEFGRQLPTITAYVEGAVNR